MNAIHALSQLSYSPVALNDDYRAISFDVNLQPVSRLDSGGRFVVGCKRPFGERGSAIGAANPILLAIFTDVPGACLARKEGLRTYPKTRLVQGSRDRMSDGEREVRFPSPGRSALITLLFLLIVLEGCYSLKTTGMREEFVVMEVTAYCACKRCCGWKHKYGCCLFPPVYASGPRKGERKQVGITADGSKAKKGTIAADTSRYPFGTIMYVPGYGWGEVHDRGTAIQGNRIDLFFSSHKKALEWGRRTVKVKVYR